MEINLSNNISFTALNKRSILDSAREAGFILKHSCRTGRCGLCKTKVLSGETEIIHAENSLTKKELSDGFILTCCRSAKNDLYLDTEDLNELAKYPCKTLPCRINSIRKLSKDVAEIFLRTPPSSKLKYLPGQYINLIAKDGLRRSYSIANAPREDGEITLHIRKVEVGSMSRYWFSDAKENDLLRFEGPLGSFFLRETSLNNLILLATGTGIGPIKAILEKLSQDKARKVFDQIFLYWGGRYLNDLYWQPTFTNLPLKFIKVLSRETTPDSFKGYVQSAVIDDMHDLGNSVVYACGSEVMIKAAYNILIASGLNNKNFYSDAFVSSS